jgi:hypothetical protein
VTRNLQYGFLALAIVALGTTAAQAQTDFSGEWTVVRSMDNTENPWVGDWVGLPFNPDGIARAESWDASLLSLPEYQCRPHGWPYIYRGPTALRITKEVDPFTREVVAFHPEWHQSTNMPSTWTAAIVLRPRPTTRGADSPSARGKATC